MRLWEWTMFAYKTHLKFGSRRPNAMNLMVSQYNLRTEVLGHYVIKVGIKLWEVTEGSIIEYAALPKWDEWFNTKIESS